MPTSGSMNSGVMRTAVRIDDDMIEKLRRETEFDSVKVEPVD